MIKIANSPEELNKILNEFEWSCIVDNRKVESTEENWNKYRTLSSEQFLELRAGCCWDFCNFQSEYFDIYFPEIEYKLFIVDSEDSNHTFMIYREDNKIKLFESSYKKYCRIYSFREVQEVIDFYIDKLEINYYRIYIYNRLENQGILAEEFMNYIWNEGKLIISR